MRACLLCLLASCCLCRTTQADIVNTFVELESILGGQIVLEDFEGFSIPGGTSLNAPNPLNSTSAPSTWGISPGVTYSTANTLTFYAGQLLGDDSNVLAAHGGSPLNQLRLAFDKPQLAAGFYLVNITGNLDYNETITFFHNALELGSLALLLPQASERFIGWQDPRGITHVTVGSDSFAIVDNVAFGVTAVPEPPILWLMAVALAAFCVHRRTERWSSRSLPTGTD